MASQVPEVVAPPEAAPKPMSSNALVSLVLFAAGLILPLVLHVMGLVFGILGIRETGVDGPRRGRGLAVLGTTLNAIAVVAMCTLILFVVYFGIIRGDFD